jgi:hypothetical protein
MYLRLPSFGLAIPVALLTAVATAQVSSTPPPTLDEWRVVAKECSDVAPPQAKIQRCLKLLNDPRISDTYVAAINMEISRAFAYQGDYNNAIKYKKIGIEHAQAWLKRQRLAGEAMRGNLGAMSLSYTELGQLEALNRLASLETKSDEARKIAREEESSYTLALQFDPTNHKAYRYRAEIRSLFCDSASAAQDLQKAIALAERKGDENAVRSYKTGTLGICIPEWRGASRY